MVITNSIQHDMKSAEMILKDHWITTWHHNLSTKILRSNYNMIELVYDMEVYLVKLPYLGNETHTK